jgi:hypothetical protein
MLVATLWVGWMAFGVAATGSAADVLTLKDGQVVVGQVVESERRGPVVMLVRRGWAEANLPARFAAWKQAEVPLIRKAEAMRHDRLVAWRRERRLDAAGGDRITPWLDQELARPAAGATSPLMVVKLGRSEVKSLERASSKDGRMLRLGWLSNLPEVETMSRTELATALDGRGFSAEVDTPVSVESLLPTPIETEAQWLVRRAATEARNDPGCRLIRYQGMILPEAAIGEAPPAAEALSGALGSLKELLGEAPVEPLPGKLREMAGQGRSGVVVTRLELAPDLSAASVETTLWARGGDRWVPAIVRTSTARPDDLPANEGAGLAEDPQVKAAFGVVSMLGLGEVSPELQRRSLRMGAATREALGRARSALDRELDTLAISLEPRREASPATPPATRH